MPKRLQVQDIGAAGSLRPVASPASGFAPVRVPRPALSALVNLQSVNSAARQGLVGAARERISNALGSAEGVIASQDDLDGLTAEEAQERIKGLPEASDPRVHRAYWELAGARVARERVNDALDDALASGVLTDPRGEDGELLPGGAPIEERITEIIGTARSTPLLGNAFASTSFEAQADRYGAAVERKARSIAAQQQIEQTYGEFVQQVSDSARLIAGHGSSAELGPGAPATVTATDFQDLVAFNEQARGLGLRQHKMGTVAGLTAAVKATARDDRERALEMVDAFRDLQINGVSLGDDATDMGGGRTVSDHFQELEDWVIKESAKADMRAEEDAQRAAIVSERKMQLSIGKVRRRIADEEGAEAALEFALEKADDVEADHGFEARAVFLREARLDAEAARRDRQSQDGLAAQMLLRSARGEDVRTSTLDLVESGQLTDTEGRAIILDVEKQQERRDVRPPAFNQLESFAGSVLPNGFRGGPSLVQHTLDNFYADYDAQLDEVVRTTEDVDEIKSTMGKWVRDNRERVLKPLQDAKQSYEAGRLEFYQGYYDKVGRFEDSRPAIDSALAQGLINEKEAGSLLGANADAQRRRAFFTDTISNPQLARGVQDIKAALRGSADEDIRKIFNITNDDPQEAVLQWERVATDRLAAGVREWVNNTLPTLPAGSQETLFRQEVSRLVREQSKEYLSEAGALATQASSGLPEGASVPERAKFFVETAKSVEQSLDLRRASEQGQLTNVTPDHAVVRQYRDPHVDPKVYQSYTDSIRRSAGFSPSFTERMFNVEATPFGSPSEVGRRIRAEAVRLNMDASLSDSARTKAVEKLLSMRGMSSAEFRSGSVTVGLSKEEKRAYRTLRGRVPRAAEKLLILENEFTHAFERVPSIWTTPVSDWGDLTTRQKENLMRSQEIPVDQLDAMNAQQALLTDFVR